MAAEPPTPRAGVSDGSVGVYVLGMHRSGTSATTRAVNLLGVPLGAEEELKAESPNNPTGFWEVPRLTDFNNKLLFELGGSSMGPPLAEVGWERRPALERKRERGRSLFAAVHREASWAWKDPRNCVTLPFWLETLDAGAVAILVHRDPIAIWRSLARRQGLSKAMSLAVWERYMRCVLGAVRGLPVYVTSYSELTKTPGDWARAVASFLDRHALDRGPGGDASAVERFVEAGASNDPPAAAAEEGPDVSGPQRALLETVESLAGEHDLFPEVELPPETDWAEPLLAERRRADLLRVQMQERIRSMRKRLREARAERRAAERALEGKGGGRGPGLSDSGRQRRAEGRLPDFLVIGAQKSGTSSLYRWLGEASSIEVPSKKELHFFDLNFAEGLDWYRDCFAGLDASADGCRVLTGEASPYYLFHPLAPARVKQTLPDVRLLAVLRDPVHRAVSHYYHEVGNGVESLPLEAALDQEPERLAGEAERIAAEPGYDSFNHRHFSYQARGVYVDQLRAWRELFGEDQLLVLQSERLFSDPGPEMARVHEFLGVAAEPPADPPAWNQRSYPSIAPQTEQRLVRRFAPDNARLYELLGEDLGW